MIEGLLPDLPEPASPFGEPFVRAEIFIESPTRVVYMAPPPPPIGAIYEWDRDAECDVFVRPMTDGEKAAEREGYERASAEWRKTGGRYRIKDGPTTTYGKFYTVRGARIEATLYERTPGKPEWCVTLQQGSTPEDEERERIRRMFAREARGW
jgi:hypothetical protein